MRTATDMLLSYMASSNVLAIPPQDYLATARRAKDVFTKCLDDCGSRHTADDILTAYLDNPGAMDISPEDFFQRFVEAEKTFVSV